MCYHTSQHKSIKEFKEGEKAEAWVLPDLTKPEMADLMKTYENDDKLITYRVLDGVTNSRIDTNVPEVIEPLRTP